MPLLICPNDNSAMQEIDRNGVLIDVCPECRGVWMDRGELEKLLQLVEGRASRDDRGRGSDARSDNPGAGPERRHDDRDRGDYRRDDYDRKKRKRRFDIFDFFD